MRACVVAVIAVWAASVAPAPVRAQVDRFDQFRIFLLDGHALPSYGAFAIVGDRIVFTLPIGPADAPPELQLMSLPLSSVDLERTEMYSATLRAARYAVTRGEADYAAMTAEVSRTIADLRDVEDPARRLALAQEARRRLLEWSRANYSYRAADVQELAGLFDEVITELRVAAGEPTFEVDLRSGLAPAPAEPLLDGPTFSQSVSHALHAATVADIDEERVAVLRAASAAVTRHDGNPALRMAVDLTLEAELDADRAYAELEGALQSKAEAARAAADVEALEALLVELDEGDARLGRRRVARVRALRTRLEAFVEETLARRRDRERYAALRGAWVEYELAIRPVTSALDGLIPVLEHIRDLRYMSFRTIERAQPRVERLPELLAALEVPEGLSDVHATLASAVHMAREAIAQWRAAAIAGRTDRATEASAAASGALLLTPQAKNVLLDRLFPGRR